MVKPPETSPLDRNARDMIAFAAKWEPFVGGDEYILPEFGVQPGEFYRRLAHLLTDDRAPVD